MFSKQATNCKCYASVPRCKALTNNLLSSCLNDGSQPNKAKNKSLFWWGTYMSALEHARNSFT